MDYIIMKHNNYTYILVLLNLKYESNLNHWMSFNLNSKQLKFKFFKSLIFKTKFLFFLFF
jgi:hypothetical protein